MGSTSVSGFKCSEIYKVLEIFPFYSLSFGKQLSFEVLDFALGKQEDT